MQLRAVITDMNETRWARKTVLTRQAGKSAKTAFEIAREIGVIGIDGDRRRNVAKYHSKYLKAGGKYRKMR